MLKQAEDGSYIIPNDYDGNVSMLKVGYPKDSKFVYEKDLKPGEPPSKDALPEPPAPPESTEKKSEGEPTDDAIKALYEMQQRGEVITPEDLKEFGIENKAKLVEYLAGTRGMITELSEKANKNPFASFDVDEDTIKEALLSKESPDTYKSYMKLKHGNVGDIDVLVAQRMKNDPDVFTSEEKARSFVEDEYGLMPLIPITNDLDEDEVAAIEAENAKIKRKNENISIKIKLDAKKAKEEILNSVNKYEVPKRKSAEDIKAENQTYVDKWTPVFKEDIAVEKEIDVGGGVKYELSQEASILFQRAAAQYVSDNRIEPTKENIEKIKKYASNVVFIEYRDDIIKNIATNVRKMADADFDKYVADKFFNPSALKKDEPKNPVTKSSGVSEYITNLRGGQK